MGSEYGTELARQHRALQERYDYFLMAAAATGIALSLQRTVGFTLRYSMIPLGIAVTLWGISFLAGCLRQRRLAAFTGMNLELIIAETGIHPDIGADHQAIQVYSQELRKIMKCDNLSGCRCARVQLWSLVLGGISYVTWHVAEIAIKTAAGRPGP